MVEVRAVTLRFAAVGLAQVQRADAQVRAMLQFQGALARKERSSIDAWFKAHRAALIGIGAATTALLAGIIAASPNLSARMNGIRLEFSLLAMDIGQHLDPAFQAAEDAIHSLRKGFAALPEGVQGVISWSALIVATLGGIGVALAALETLFTGTVVAKLFWALVGEIQAGAAAANAAFASIPIAASAALAATAGAIAGFGIVFAAEKTGMLDKINELGRGFGESLPAWVRDGLTAVLSYVVGGLALLGAVIVAFVRGEGFEGALNRAKDLLDQWGSAWGRTFDRIREHLAAFVVSFVVWLVGLGETLGAWISTLPERGRALVDRIRDGIQDRWGGFTHWLAVKLIELGNGIAEWVGGAYAWGLGVVNKIIDGIAAGWASLSAWVNALASLITNGIKSVIDSAWRWGNDLINNFIAGLQAGFAWLDQAVANIRNKLNIIRFDDPANDRMAARWGSDFVMHFARGVDATAYRIERAIAGITPTLAGPGAAPFVAPAPAAGGAPTIHITLEAGAVQVSGAEVASFNEERLAERVADRVGDRFYGRSR